MSGALRLYAPDELGKDGYPPAWHRCSRCDGTGWLCDACESPQGKCECSELACSGCPDCWTTGGCGGEGSIKALVRACVEHRCVRCGHPYRQGEHGNGEWSPCDEGCSHAGPLRWATFEKGTDWFYIEQGRENDGWAPGSLVQVTRAAVAPYPCGVVHARWRILTVHHLDGDKANCRWWNLAPLCQRCHLQIQGRVQMARIWPWEHSEWFKPYVAGFYAWTYLGEELTRAEVMARLGDLLDLERVA